MAASNPRDEIVASVSDLVKRYGTGGTAVTALDGVTLSLRRGDFTAIMGPSGSGKSTLMHIMAGLDSASSGRVILGGTDITGLDDGGLTELRRRRVGFVFQSFNLLPTLDVNGNIRLPFELDGRRPSGEEEKWLEELIDQLGLRGRQSHRPSQLSGGQQQRVAIARALATRPEIVFADEPTGNLDSRTGREVLGLLAEARAQHGQSIAMVTHDPMAASYADRILFLADGQIVRDSGRLEPEEIANFMLSIEVRG